MRRKILYLYLMRSVGYLIIGTGAVLLLVFMMVTEVSYNTEYKALETENLTKAEKLQHVREEQTRTENDLDQSLAKQIYVATPGSNSPPRDLRQLISQMSEKELDDLRDYLLSQERSAPTPKITSLDGNSTLQILRLRLLQELTNATFQKILEATLQGRPLNDRPRPQSMQIIIATTWRSGSTFLEQLLEAHPGVFNHYEPLIMYKFQRFYKEDPLAEEVQSLVIDLLKCKYSNAKYIAMAKHTPDVFQRNSRLWNVCQNKKMNNQLCYQRDFLEAACEIFPWTLMKFVRLGVDLVEPVFQDPTLNPHLIFLVRDPRAVVYSRQKTVNWCKYPVCSDPKILCQHMNRDLSAALDLSSKYEGRVHILRYEDLSLSPVSKTEQLLQELGWDFDPAMDEFIKEHTTKNWDKPWSTYRQSSKRVTYWTSQIKESTLEEVQNSCSDVMQRLGYKSIQSKDEDSVDDLLIPLNLTLIT